MHLTFIHSAPKINISFNTDLVDEPLSEVQDEPGRVGDEEDEDNDDEDSGEVPRLPRLPGAGPHLSTRVIAHCTPSVGNTWERLFWRMRK